MFSEGAAIKVEQDSGGLNDSTDSSQAWGSGCEEVGPGNIDFDGGSPGRRRAWGWGRLHCFARSIRERQRRYMSSSDNGGGGSAANGEVGGMATSTASSEAPGDSRQQTHW